MVLDEPERMAAFRTAARRLARHVVAAVWAVECRIFGAAVWSIHESTLVASPSVLSDGGVIVLNKMPGDNPLAMKLAANVRLRATRIGWAGSLEDRRSVVGRSTLLSRMSIATIVGIEELSSTPRVEIRSP